MPTTVDLIRNALEKRDGLSEEVMSPLSDAYSDEVTRVNERLSEGVALLRKGLRSEAIQRASLHPNAVDGAANLDFPEVGEWVEILQFLGVSVPPLIDQDAAQQLNEAIVETQPLNELLRRHRKLAIAKAPLAWRLRVLRRIAHVDPMNSVWEEDLESWEQVRLKQIPAELSAFISDGDAHAVEAIRDELTTQSWRVEPSKRLIKEARGAADQYIFDDQTERLGHIAPQLHDAFGQFDEPLARTLRDQWRQVQAEMSAPAPVELQDQVAPAFAWLEQLDNDAAATMERSAAVGELERALDQRKDVADLQRCYQRASRFDEPIPIELEQRFRVTVAEHELRKKRKTQAIMASIVAATLLVAAAVGYWQWNAHQQSQITSVTTEMKTLLEEKKYQEAQTYLDRIKQTQPAVAQTAEMVSLASQLSGHLSKDESRVTQFQSYLQQARNENPADIDAAALAKADSLAVSEEEKAAVFEVQRLQNQWDRDVQAEQTKTALDELAVIRTQLETIESAPISAETIKQATILVDQVGKLASLYPRRSSSSDSQIGLVKTRATAIRDAMRQQRSTMQTQSDALKRLMKSTSLPGFADSLDAYVRDLPSSPMSKEFTQVSAERKLWTQALTTNDLLKNLQQSLPGGISPTEASTILQAIAQVKAVVADNPAMDAIPDIENTLTDIEGRAATLDRVFSDIATQSVAELVTLESPSNEDPGKNLRYFLYYSHFDRFRDRFKTPGRVGIEIVVNQSGAVKNQAFEGPLGTPNPEPRATVRWLMNKKQDERGKFLSDWDGEFMKTAAELRARPKLDGMVKEILLLHLLQGAASGSDTLRSRLANSITSLERRGEIRQRWYVPKPLDSSFDPDVERLVVPAMSQAYTDRNSILRAIMSASRQEYQWVGFLLRDQTGALAAQITRPPQNVSGPLYLIGSDATNPSMVSFSQIATWNKDHVVLRSSGSDAFAGRPIFFLSGVTNAAQSQQ